MEKQQRPPVYYSEYLQLDKILNAQQPESEKEGIVANDEMLFIVIHQTYEMWFKLILHEIDVVRNIFKQTNVPDNSPEIYNAFKRLKRITEVLEILVSQISVIETMTAMDFLDFRDLLRPASGFQSIQFKQIEAALGLTYANRYGKDYYTSQLNEKDIERVKKIEADVSLLVLINNWLERMPFAEDAKYWQSTTSFWEQYRDIYAKGLQQNEQNNLTTFEHLFIHKDKYPEGRSLSSKASGSAFFIMLYRDFPKLQLPFEILDTLLEIDGLMAQWRNRHIQMVQRTIGKRTGTGGSTGATYLKAAADSHYVFKELSELTSFLLPRRELPTLPESLREDLCFKE